MDKIFKSVLIFSSILAISTFYSSFKVSKAQTSKKTQSEKTEARETYLTVKKLWYRWKSDFFGDGKYYKRELQQFLLQSIGREFNTDSNYMIAYPEVLTKDVFVSKFPASRWLRIRGSIDREHFKLLIKKEGMELKKWWRLSKLVSISGKLKRFRLDDGDKTVVIYLENLRFYEIKDK